MKSFGPSARIAGMLCLIVIFAGITRSTAQDRLKAMLGYDQYTKMQPIINQAFVTGALGVTWASDGKTFTYTQSGKTYRYDVATLKAAEGGDAQPASPGTRDTRSVSAAAGGQTQASPAGRDRGGSEPAQTGVAAYAISGCPQTAVARGRQADCVVSPDNKWKAFHLDRNLWIANYDGTGATAVTKDGNEKDRIKYGIATWVYGEELAQTTAIWWSPDSKNVGFYRFDESQVKDFYLALNTTQVQDKLDVEAYPKPGAPNPIPDLFVYDVVSARTTMLDVRDGKPFENDVIGYYIYDVRWSPDGTELMFNRTNRRQQILEFATCNPTTGKCGVILREEWLTGWLNTYPAANPSMSPRWLKDGKHFIWQSERNGWSSYYLYNISGKLVAPLTANNFEAANIIKLDETAGVMFYLARDGDNYMKLQLHRVGLELFQR